MEQSTSTFTFNLLTLIGVSGGWVMPEWARERQEGRDKKKKKNKLVLAT